MKSMDGMKKRTVNGWQVELRRGRLYVDGELNTKIHTSCSQPIGPGLVSGDFLVVAGESREGGEGRREAEADAEARLQRSRKEADVRIAVLRDQAETASEERKAKIESRVFSSAQTAARPEATCCQPMMVPLSLLMKGWVMRSGPGSAPECLPKKLSSWTAAREV